MAQAGAQREPSMEEILASIRRIIESNEPGEQPLADDSTDVDLDAAADADVGRLSHASLADVAARVRAETTGSVEAVREHDAADLMRLALVSDEPEPARQSEPAKQSEAVAQAVPAQTPVAAEQQEQTVSPRAASPFPPRQAYPAPPEPVAAQAEPVVSHAQPAVHSEAEAEAETDQPVQESAGQLISMDAGAKVAASFDHLTATLAASNTRSFDEIAEELLKPMLQNWLDDNLPTLVERLVREEIERVSRGTRR